MDDKLEFQLIKNNFNEIEKIRLKSFNIKSSQPNPYYKQEFTNGKMLIMGCYYKKELLGCAYILNSLNSLFIERIFVKPEYQKHSLHIGYNLQNYILQNKQIFEKYFKTKFNISRLEPANNNVNHSLKN